jgi:hypothetical protein
MALGARHSSQSERRLVGQAGTTVRVGLWQRSVFLPRVRSKSSRQAIPIVSVGHGTRRSRRNLLSSHPFGSPSQDVQNDLRSRIESHFCRGPVYFHTSQGVVSVVSVPPPAVFQTVRWLAGFHGMLAIWKKIHGGPTVTTDTTPCLWKSAKYELTQLTQPHDSPLLRISRALG